MKSVVSNIEKPSTPPLRRSTRDRKPVDILDPSPSLSQVGKSRLCNKKLRRSKSPSKKFPMKRPPTPKWTKVYDGKVLDELALVQFVCMTAIAEGEGTPVDINILDLVDMSKAFAQTSSVDTSKTAKPEKYSLKRGLKVYGEKGHAAVQSELSQIHDRGVFEPQDPKKLSYQEIKDCLESHLFLEEKRSKDIKGRIVGGGNKERSYVSKQEASSPTSHTESVFCTIGIEAEEERDVAITDISNAFVQTDLALNGKPVFVLMAIRGVLANMLVKIAPEVYGHYLTKDKKGNSLLYVKLLKALYGLMEASLMFYQKLRKDLEDLGFKVKPYDPCVANKMIDGSQFTIVWHVDDLKMSHKNPHVVTKMINHLKKLYERLSNGEIKHMTVQRGKSLNYLGMNFDLKTRGEVAITMTHHINKVINEFPGKLRNLTHASPNSPKLFEVRKEAKDLDPENAKIFHRLVAQLLYISKRSRLDLALSVPFLTTRVCKPSEDDWKKLRMVIEYLKQTIDLPLILKVDKTKPDVWSIDAAYAVHADCKSHTGGSFTMGSGSFFSISCKQKTNCKSSCEAELVAVDDCIGSVLRIRHFLLEGPEIAKNLIF